jgi:hypothetical protein
MIREGSVSLVRRNGRHSPEEGTMGITTHTMRNGFCTQCGELEEWLTATGETMVSADAPAEPEFAGSVRHSLSTGYYAAVVTRKGAKRATDVCKHGHKTRAAAEKCSDKLVALRNAKASK